MQISVIGTGYVGLVAGTCFAENGHDVTCVDIDEKRIEELKNGIVPFYEPGLRELCIRNIKNERLFFTTDVASAIQTAKIIFIAVGTPSLSDGSSDLGQVTEVAKTIAEHLNTPKIIVIKSTVPVGSFKKIENIIRQGSKTSFSIVSNPEFLKEGAAVSDFLNPERVVIGSRDKKAIRLMKELYAPFVRSGNPILVMDNASAELSKYACNSFMAMKISINKEKANLCETLGTNIDDIRQVMMTDARIGRKFLYPGIGYGGSCFPKDVRSLINASDAHSLSLKVLKAVEEVNNVQKELLFKKAFHYFKGGLKDKRFAIWGLAFKPNTDDIREAPALTLIRKLLDHEAKITVYDPIALSNVRLYFENRIEYSPDNYQCLKGADALMICTEWNEFRKPDFSKMKSLLKNPVIFDGRNLFQPKEIKKHGFIYRGIGVA